MENIKAKKLVREFISILSELNQKHLELRLLSRVVLGFCIDWFWEFGNA
jgi:hypothetical protein